MALTTKQKNKRDELVADLDMKIKDKQDLIARLTSLRDEEISKVQDDLDELLLRRDGLRDLK